VLRQALNSMLYFPARSIDRTPTDAGLEFRDIELTAEDGKRLHGWWVPASAPSRGHVLFCHGNAGNIGDRVAHAALLSAAGFDVLLFDYRGYGRSSGRPNEHGTYRDARAACRALRDQPGVDVSRVIYLGESLGGAVALELALAHPPAGLVLQSTFNSVRDLARLHYPYIPRGWCPTPTRAARGSPTCRLHCWSSTANGTRSSRRHTARHCSRPRRRPNGCTWSATLGTTTWSPGWAATTPA
jgi:pimeloyl-ACP methyl ester carboxylesterase